MFSLKKIFILSMTVCFVVIGCSKPEHISNEVYEGVLSAQKTVDKCFYDATCDYETVYTEVKDDNMNLINLAKTDEEKNLVYYTGSLNLLMVEYKRLYMNDGDWYLEERQYKENYNYVNFLVGKRDKY
ncbi:hypothetical protein [Alkalihalobacillus sp. LMS39]|uniref:hypothetical protein n=1 Tax=Alkalihalobacillus sp. LMS39 TaxID=2924032 RepID=UPI001FB4DD7E|nr:hypothetical protein [Alkalihalobacillus sp. LMS39]UOE94100.1 hypothetical protein MM271_23505 [Alkalihalobacillus sp. LMS39]